MQNFKQINYDEISDNYYINNIGEVYNSKTNKKIKGSHDKNGYIIYILKRKDGSFKTYKAHRLVMIIFNYIDNHSDLQVNHIDGNKQNNSIENLEWCTCKENIEHAIMMNLKKKRTNLVINEDECCKICCFLQNGYSPTMIAQKLYPNEEKKYQQIIFDIKRKKNWVDISDKYDIDVDYKYKNFSSKYSIWDIENICEQIKMNKSNKDISLNVFGLYNKNLSDLISGIKCGRKYKEVSKYYF